MYTGIPLATVGVRFKQIDWAGTALSPNSGGHRMDRLSAADSQPQAVDVVTRGANTSAVSWPAIIAGTVAAAASSLILLALGSGIGLASVSPWPSLGASATTFTVITAIWLIVVQWLASGLGGYLTGRLRSRWLNTHTHEVFFRDTAHGLLAWALATVLGTLLFASAVSSAIGTGVRAAGSATSGGFNTTASGINPYYVDMLFRTTRDAGDSASNANAEATRILGQAVIGGNMPSTDRSYLAQVVAAKTGVSQEEAQRRVDDVTAQVRQAADTTRKAGAMASIYLALSMLIGAFIAGIGAVLGGRARDLHP